MWHAPMGANFMMMMMTLVCDRESRDIFYSELTETLRSIDLSYKALLLGDFNTRVGARRYLWEQAIGRHGIGKMKASSLRLLTLCA